MITQQSSSQASFKSLQAGADWLANGAVEVPIFESEIVDLRRENSIALERLPHVQATGDPHRYLEATAFGTAQFDNKRAISPVPSNITRVDRSAVIKCLDNETNIGLYDRLVTQQQDLFAGVVAKDIESTATSVILLSAQKIWTGNDTSLVTPTTNEYMGLLTQITNVGYTAVIAPGASIIDGFKSMVAKMISNLTYKVKPTAFYMNPELGDFLDQEAKAANITFGSTTVVGGVEVDTIRTRVGTMPIITEVFLGSDTIAAYGFDAPPVGYSNYYVVILMEPLIEMAYITERASPSPYPKIYQLGLQSGLDGKFVAILFDNIIAKGAAYAHAVIAVQRPTV